MRRHARDVDNRRRHAAACRYVICRRFYAVAAADASAMIRHDDMSLF